jgi:hypothetical protein
MRYVMLIGGDEKEWETRPQDDAEASMARTYAWFDKWAGAGKIAEGGAQLQHTRTAKTIRGSGSDVVVTDGPFIETKEVLGGVVMLECESLDEAVEIASTWPGLDYSSVVVEVRPIVDHSGGGA